MAVRKAGRVVASVAAVALLGVAVAACDSDDSDDGKGASRKVTESRGSEGRLESDSPSEGAASEGSASEGATPSASPEAVPEAKVPPVSAGQLAKVPAAVKGGVITVGKPSAKHTVKVYEDPRCPFCKKFEEGGAQALVGPLSAGDVKVEYTIASFLDKNFGGSGSVNAANALRAAVEAGKFPQFHSAVFTNQPEESEDAFTPAFLLKIADTVGLRDAAFKKAVNNGTYKSWVGTAMEAFGKDGISGTPTVVVDGEKAPSESLYSEGDFKKVLKDAGIS
ncbi:thioredoxin domain-containing protein [Streptomyces aurantiacus]|uniref:Putative Disulfide bond formation protein D n=1 Tax=Streptomyces aurantiacus JA 4570 TaxID=1286094 RepID=S3ZD17_9ACTN|nr:thioredoxin domain-containing protein [Streptomyces aurantiacus]EPH41566.1 putative Disulfide bond formation protein D [Streptomyces aurantiacus JA 4570]